MSCMREGVRGVPAAPPPASPFASLDMARKRCSFNPSVWHLPDVHADEPNGHLKLKLKFWVCQYYLVAESLL